MAEPNGHLVPRTTQDHWRQVGPSGQYEYQEAAGADTWKAQRESHLPEGLPFRAAHASGGLKKTLINPFEAYVYIQNHKREQVLDKPHED